MEKINETTFISKELKKEIVLINDHEYSLLSNIEKLELLLTIKNWVKFQIDIIATS